jgi:hypothetical protein
MQMKPIRLHVQILNRIPPKQSGGSISNSPGYIRGGEVQVGKKHRNRINSPKKNNHIPPEAIVAEHEAHGKEYSAERRKK